MAHDTVQEIKDRLSIQDVVAPHVTLRRAGRSFTGLCPFHKEKTPSFHVSLERGTYHCFGCGEGGDIFSFIEKVEGVDFKGALKMLAEKAGVEIMYDSKSRERTEKNDRLHEVMNRAAQWYVQQLVESEAQVYAKRRGLTDESIKNWGLGFAPDSWRSLLEMLTNDGFTIEEMLAAGLIKEAEGKVGTYYDRFRNRLLFPIRDSVGRVVAFTGRTLSADEPAKYLNSPETDLYHKSDILYGMDRAKDAIRTRGFAMLVEGQMDAIHAHQTGFENAVALSGTALTTRHVKLIKRFSDNLMLVLDADTAGLSATAKSAQLALIEGLKVKAARLPQGKDPADLITEDSKNFTTRVKSAQSIVEFFLGVLGENERDAHRLIALAERVVLPLIRAIKSPMEREHFVQIAARTLGLSPEAVRETLGRSEESNILSEEKPLQTISIDTHAIHTKSSREVREGRLLAIMQAYPESSLAKHVKTEYLRITEVRALPTEASPESAVFEAEHSFGEGPSESAADELLHAFEEAVIREAYQEAVGDLRRAETAGNAAAVDSAQSLCSKLSERLASLGQ